MFQNIMKCPTYISSVLFCAVLCCSVLHFISLLLLHVPTLHREYLSRFLVVFRGLVEIGDMISLHLLFEGMPMIKTLTYSFFITLLYSHYAVVIIMSTSVITLQYLVIEYWVNDEEFGNW